MKKDHTNKKNHDNVVNNTIFRMLQALEEAGRQVNPEGEIKFEVLDLTKVEKKYG